MMNAKKRGRGHREGRKTARGGKKQRKLKTIVFINIDGKNVKENSAKSNSKLY